MAQLIPPLCRAARGLLDWTQEDLAKAAGVCRSTIRDFEKGHHALQRGSEQAVMNALQGAGVSFLFEPTGPGVALRTQSPP